MKKHKKIIIPIVVVIISLIITTIGLWFNEKSEIQLSKENLTDLSNSLLNKDATDSNGDSITNSIASMVVAPYTESNEETISNFVYSYTSVGYLDISNLEGEPTHIISLILASDGEDSGLVSSTVGIPIIVLQYSTTSEAQTAGEALTLADTGVGVLAYDNYLVLYLIGVDVENIIDFDTTAFTTQLSYISEEDSLWYWLINFEGGTKLLNAYDENDGIDPSDETSNTSIFGGWLESIGFTLSNANPSGYWVGTSTDGLNWEGNFDTNSVNILNPDNISYSNGETVLSKSTIYYYNGEYLTPEQLDQVYIDECEETIENNGSCRITAETIEISAKALNGLLYVSEDGTISGSAYNYDSSGNQVTSDDGTIVYDDRFSDAVNDKSGNEGVIFLNPNDTLPYLMGYQSSFKWVNFEYVGLFIQNDSLSIKLYTYE